MLHLQGCGPRKDSRFIAVHTDADVDADVDANMYDAEHFKVYFTLLPCFAIRTSTAV